MFCFLKYLDSSMRYLLWKKLFLTVPVLSEFLLRKLRVVPFCLLFIFLFLRFLQYFLVFWFTFTQILVEERILQRNTFHSGTPSQTNDSTKWVCCERRCWLGIAFFLLGQCIFDLFYDIIWFAQCPTPRNYQQAHVIVFAPTRRHTYFFIFFLCYFLLAWRVVIRRVCCFLKNR